jgi:hypothetical protein
MLDINIIDNYIDIVANFKRPMSKAAGGKIIPFLCYHYRIHNPHLQAIIKIACNLILIFF